MAELIDVLKSKLNEPGFVEAIQSLLTNYNQNPTQSAIHNILQDTQLQPEKPYINLGQNKAEGTAFGLGMRPSQEKAILPKQTMPPDYLSTVAESHINESPGFTSGQSSVKPYERLLMENEGKIGREGLPKEAQIQDFVGKMSPEELQKLMHKFSKSGDYRVSPSQLWDMAQELVGKVKSVSPELGKDLGQGEAENSVGVLPNSFKDIMAMLPDKALSMYGKVEPWLRLPGNKGEGTSILPTESDIKQSKNQTNNPLTTIGPTGTMYSPGGMI